MCVKEDVVGDVHLRPPCSRGRQIADINFDSFDVRFQAQYPSMMEMELGGYEILFCSIFQQSQPNPNPT